MSMSYTIPISDRSDFVNELGIDPFYEEDGLWKINDDTISLFLENGVDINQASLDLYSENFIDRYQTESEPVELSDSYCDSYAGRLYVKRNRWYGLNINYGEGYENANYNHKSSSYTSVVALPYNKSVGSVPMKNGTLKKLILNIPRVSGTIDNLQIQIVKTQKQSGSSSVDGETIYHENTKEKGHYLLSNRSYLIKIELDESCTTNDVFTMLLNSSSSSNSTRYLYSTTVKWIYS